MSSSGSVKLRYEMCLQVWGNAIEINDTKEWADFVIAASKTTNDGKRKQIIYNTLVSVLFK